MLETENILRAAKDAGASDLHMTVGVPPTMRINGELAPMDYPKLKPEDTAQALESVAPPHAKERFHAKGECDFSFSIPSAGRFRVNAYQQRGSTALAFRVVKTQIPTAAELGIPRAVTELSQCRRGLVLVTGPTGSGKSTTQACMIDLINHSRSAHILTLEDPIEFLHRHDMSIVDQREVGTDTESFASALRAALREDPDVIFVGEMRDFETISVAMTAAETGHLVLSTLHTMSAAASVDRIIDMFPPQHQQQAKVQLANVLTAVISQQLLPMSQGRGRTAAFEVMLVNSAVRSLIREGKTHQLQNVIQTNKKAGMITMDEAISQLYYSGKITRDMAMQFAWEPGAIDL